MEINILIVEDDAAIARVIQLYLRKSGYLSEICGSGTQAIQQLHGHHYSLVILDRMLPGRNGLQVLSFIRKKYEELPVLMVTAMGHVKQRVEGLNQGADDYLAKPFEPSELIARVQSLLRRSKVSVERMVFGQLTLDIATATVRVGGQPLALRPLEFKLLHTLILKRDRICNREYLLDYVWGTEAEVEPRTVDVCVKRVRTALKEHQIEHCISTVRSVGYRFLEDRCC